MKTVWKYVLATGPGRTRQLELPKGASPVRVGMQGPLLCMWVCVVAPELGEMQERRDFLCSGTGLEVPLNAKYIGGCADGPFEWHVWETT